MLAPLPTKGVTATASATQACAPSFWNQPIVRLFRVTAMSVHSCP